MLLKFSIWLCFITLSLVNIVEEFLLIKGILQKVVSWYQALIQDNFVWLCNWLLPNFFKTWSESQYDIFAFSCIFASAMNFAYYKKYKRIFLWSVFFGTESDEFKIINSNQKIAPSFLLLKKIISFFTIFAIISYGTAFRFYDVPFSFDYILIYIIFLLMFVVYIVPAYYFLYIVIDTDKGIRALFSQAWIIDTFLVLLISVSLIISYFVITHFFKIWGLI